ncbi:hypothetical protein [Paenibacillus macerans]|uniref:hypothetical protein n=1 Tax=Paenibacillus macerans TaxID=44252 RepID=UPI003D313651
MAFLRKWRGYIFILIFLALLVYLQSTTKTAELVEIMEVKDHSIVVHNLGGRITEIYFNKAIDKLDKDSYYFVRYKSSMIERPKLIEIKYFKKVE